MIFKERSPQEDKRDSATSGIDEKTVTVGSLRGDMRQKWNAYVLPSDSYLVVVSCWGAVYSYKPLASNNER